MVHFYTMFSRYPFFLNKKSRSFLMKYHQNFGKLFQPSILRCIYRSPSLLIFFWTRFSEIRTKKRGKKKHAPQKTNMAFWKIPTMNESMYFSYQKLCDFPAIVIREFSGVTSIYLYNPWNPWLLKKVPSEGFYEIISQIWLGGRITYLPHQITRKEKFKLFGFPFK